MDESNFFLLSLGPCGRSYLVQASLFHANCSVMAVVEGSGSILKDMAGTHAKLFGICVLFVLCLQDVQGQYSPWTINFSWAMGYLLFEVQILIFRSILLLEIKASGSVLHPSREPLHSTSL
jgi:hypothetical protein